MVARRSKCSPLQLPLPAFVPEAPWRPPLLGCLPAWRSARRVAIDIETCDPDLQRMGVGVRRGSFIAGVSFALEDGPAFYLPLRHEGGDNVADPEAALAYLRDQAAGYSGEIVGANLNYDLDFLASSVVAFPNATTLDIQVAEPLIDPLQDSFTLDAIAQRYGLAGKNESLLGQAADAYGVDRKGGMWRLPARFVGPYAEQDARLPLAILRLQEKRIADLDLGGIFALESKLLPVLVRIRRRGVRVDMDRLDAIDKWALREIHVSLFEIANRTGIGLDVKDLKKPAALVPVIRALGIALPLTATGKDSVTNDFLESIDHPVGDAMRRARELSNLRTTFVASIRRYEIAGRIHPTYNQLRKPRDEDRDGAGEQGVKWGRVSAVHPNLQQQPIRHPEYGKKWRSIYVPDGEGMQWAKLDWSSQEPRLIVHYAELLGLDKASEMGDAYRADPRLDCHQRTADLTSAPRRDAKIIFLARCYGAGGARLCRQLGLPTEWTTNREGRSIEVAGPEGKALIATFDATVPYVRKLAKQCEHAAQTRGYIRTLLGRRLPFPPDGLGGYDRVYKALNRLIQGSGADQCKAALVAADAAGIPMQLQVHDEIDLSISSEAEGRALADIMMSIVPLSVPMVVDLEMGPSWGEVAKVAA